jgi:hypothetical protein
LPSGCIRGSLAACDCLTAVPCGTMCTEAGPEELTVLCPGG